MKTLRMANTDERCTQRSRDINDAAVATPRRRLARIRRFVRNTVGIRNGNGMNEFVRTRGKSPIQQTQKLRPSPLAPHNSRRNARASGAGWGTQPVASRRKTALGIVFVSGGPGPPFGFPRAINRLIASNVRDRDREERKNANMYGVKLKGRNL